MKYFQYGSRVVENEQMLRLHSNVKKFGNAIKSVVHFCVAIIIFVALHTLLHSLTHNTGLFTFSTYRVFMEGASYVVNFDALAMISFLYEHSVYALLSFAFSYAFAICYKIFFMSGETKDAENFVTYVRSDFSQSVQSGISVISYRHKVCFLA